VAATELEVNVKAFKYASTRIRWLHTFAIEMINDASLLSLLLETKISIQLPMRKLILKYVTPARIALGLLKTAR